MDYQEIEKSRKQAEKQASEVKECLAFIGSALFMVCLGWGLATLI